MRVFCAVNEVRHLHAVIVFDEPAADAHTVPLRYAAGGEIVFADNGADPLFAQNGKRIFFAGNRRLRCVSLVPIRPLEEVPDFDLLRAVAERFRGSPAPQPSGSAAVLVQRLAAELFFR